MSTKWLFPGVFCSNNAALSIWWFLELSCIARILVHGSLLIWRQRFAATVEKRTFHINFVSSAWGTTYSKPLTAGCFTFLAGDLARLTAFRIDTDLAPVVLEVPEEGSKATQDCERCSLRQLLHELEDEGLTDATLNGHELVRPGAGSEHGLGLICQIWIWRLLGFSFVIVEFYLARIKVPMKLSPKPFRCTFNGTMWTRWSMPMSLPTLDQQSFGKMKIRNSRFFLDFSLASYPLANWFPRGAWCQPSTHSHLARVLHEGGKCDLAPLA